MSLESKESPSEAVEQARAKARRLANSFAVVFGKDTRRSEAQKLVIDHLSACAGNGEDGNAFRFTDQGDGFRLALSAAHLDGAKSVLRIIHRQLRIATQPKETPKAKPSVKR
jgi:hypothetical protein